MAILGSGGSWLRHEQVQILPSDLKMLTSVVEIKQATTTTTSPESFIEINRLLKLFLSYKKNTKKIIGLNIEVVQKAGKQNRTALLELCDEGHCLIVQLPREEGVELPVSLFNFFNQPDFIFVGIGINKTLMKLETEFGLTCKNAFEVGHATWNLASRTGHQQYMMRQVVSSGKPINAVFEDWDNMVLTKDQIKLAAWNAHYAFSIGNVLLDA